MSVSLRNRSANVAADLSVVQLIRSAWFLSFVFIAYVVMRVIGVDIEQSFAAFALRPSKVYMLILGILSVSSFLTFYVRYGVPRKAYFIGAAVASCVVSFPLVTIAGIVSFLEQMFVPSAGTTSFLGEDASRLLTVFVFILNIFAYYMVGWLIGAGFYRFGGPAGMLYILLAIVFVVAFDIMWELELKDPLMHLFNVSKFWDIPLYVSFIGSFLLLGIGLSIIRATTKKSRVKIK